MWFRSDFGRLSSRQARRWSNAAISACRAIEVRPLRSEVSASHDFAACLVSAIGEESRWASCSAFNHSLRQIVDDREFGGDFVNTAAPGETAVDSAHNSSIAFILSHNDQRVAACFAHAFGEAAAADRVSG